MSNRIDLDDVIDLDNTPPSHSPRPRRPRKQCAYCYENKSSILRRQISGRESRALERLRRAHPDEYDQYLQEEDREAKTATEQAWELHLAGRCKNGAPHA